jgi:Protein of unknown function (DUF2905)
MSCLSIASLAKIAIFVGLSVTSIGILLLFADKIPFLWHLPGDIRIQKGDFTFFFPLTSCILISTILSIVIYFVGRK